MLSDLLNPIWGPKGLQAQLYNIWKSKFIVAYKRKKKSIILVKAMAEGNNLRQVCNTHTEKNIMWVMTILPFWIILFLLFFRLHNSVFSNFDEIYCLNW